MGCRKLDISSYYRLTPTKGKPNTSACPFSGTFSKSHRGSKPVIPVSIPGYRYYDAEMGRWLNRDPIGEDGGVNVYAYCGNSPIGSIDFRGLIKLTSGSLPDFAWTPNAQDGGGATDADVTNWQTAYAVAGGGIYTNMPNAKNHLHWYLEGKGSEYQIDFAKMIHANGNEHVRGALGFDIVDLISKIGEVPKGAFHSDWLHWRHGIDGNMTNNDWFYGIKDFRYAFKGTKYSSGKDRATFEFSISLADPYDFEKNGKNRLPLGLTTGDMRRLHDVGLANEFLVKGETAKLWICYAGSPGGLRGKLPPKLNFKKDMRMIINKSGIDTYGW